MATKVQRIMTQPIVSAVRGRVAPICDAHARDRRRVNLSSRRRRSHRLAVTDDFPPFSRVIPSVARRPRLPRHPRCRSREQNLIFRFLQTKARIQIWLYENVDTVVEGRIIVSGPSNRVATPGSVRGVVVRLGPRMRCVLERRIFFARFCVGGAIFWSGRKAPAGVKGVGRRALERANDVLESPPLSAGFRRVHEPRARRRGGGEQEEGDAEDCR